MVYGQLGIGKENNFCIFFIFIFYIFFKYSLYIYPIVCQFFLKKYMYILLFCCLFVIPLSVIVYEAVAF